MSQVPPLVSIYHIYIPTCLSFIIYWSLTSNKLNSDRTADVVQRLSYVYWELWLHCQHWYCSSTTPTKSMKLPESNDSQWRSNKKCKEEKKEYNRYKNSVEQDTVLFTHTVSNLSIVRQRSTWVVSSGAAALMIYL